jgi:hypothetical protein
MTRLLIVKAAIAALVFSTLAAMAAEGKPKTVEELSVEMKQHGWRHQFFYEEDQDQWTLLITCTLEVVSRDKDLRK